MFSAICFKDTNQEAASCFPKNNNFSPVVLFPISGHLYGVVVEAGVMPGLGAGLPGLRSVHVAASLHALNKPPALDVVKVSSPVSAADIEARVHGNTCPRVRAHLDTCGRVPQMGREQFS